MLLGLVGVLEVERWLIGWSAGNERAVNLLGRRLEFLRGDRPREDETNPCSAAKIEDDLEVCGGDGVGTYCG